MRLTITVARFAPACFTMPRLGHFTLPTRPTSQTPPSPPASSIPSLLLLSTDSFSSSIPARSPRLFRSDRHHHYYGARVTAFPSLSPPTSSSTQPRFNIYAGPRVQVPCERSDRQSEKNSLECKLKRCVDDFLARMMKELDKTECLIKDVRSLIKSYSTMIVVAVEQRVNIL